MVGLSEGGLDLQPVESIYWGRPFAEATLEQSSLSPLEIRVEHCSVQLGELRNTLAERKLGCLPRVLALSDSMRRDLSQQHAAWRAVSCDLMKV